MWKIILTFPLFLVSCSGGNTAPPPPTSQQSPGTPPGPMTPTVGPPPTPAGLIWRQDNVLNRSQTDGTGIVTLVNAPGFDPFTVQLSGSTVVYHVIAAPVPGLANFGLYDIWQVQTNGTGTGPS